MITCANPRIRNKFLLLEKSSSGDFFIDKNAIQIYNRNIIYIPKGEGMKDKLCLSLDPEVKKDLKELADERHMTQAALITFWILEEKKKKQN